MKTTRLLLMFLFSLVFLTPGCKKDPLEKPDPEPVDTINVAYVVYPDKIQALPYESVTLNWEADSADGLVISGSFGEITDVNPQKGSLTFQMVEVGVSVITCKFRFDQPNGMLDLFGVEDVYVETFSPQEVDFLSTPIPWRTSGSFHLKTHFADSTRVSYSGVDTLLIGDFDGNFITHTLDSNTLVDIVTYNKVGKVEASETINVAEPTNGDYVCKCGPWKRIRDQHSLDINFPGEDVDISDLCLQDDRRIFNQDGHYTVDCGEVLCDGQTVRFSYRDWLLSVDATILYTGSSPQFRENTLITIDDTMMVWRYESIYILDDGISWVPMWVTETFIHP